MKPLFWKRIRDDVFCVFQYGENRIEEFKSFLNSIEPRVQWTHEIEEDGVLNFMDMSVWSNDEGRLRTKVYRKKSHTLKYSNFNSNRPKHAQFGILKGLLYIAYKLCDEPEDLQEEIDFLTDIFIANDYQPEEVDKIVLTYSPKERDSNDDVMDEETKKDDVICIPYVPKCSENLQRKLGKLGVKVVFKKGQTLSDLICNVKPKKEKIRRKNVVYRIPCADCNQTYTGETAQIFEDRRGQHQACVRAQVENNGIAMHVKETKHKVDWDGFTYLDSDRFYKSRKAKESIYINSLVGGGNSVESIMNLEKGPCKLDPCWNRVYPLIRERVEQKTKQQQQNNKA